jgi:uncharacterized membrane protein YfcA
VTLGRALENAPLSAYVGRDRPAQRAPPLASDRPRRHGKVLMGFGLSLMQWAVLVTSALLIGLSKAGFGGGAALLAVPLMTYVLGPREMLSVMLFVLITGDILAVIYYPRDSDRRNLAMLIPGLLLGIGLGYLALHWFLDRPASESVRWMNRLIGALSVLFVLVQAARMVHWRRKGAHMQPYRPRYWHGISVGTCAGFTSTLANAGGPLLTIFLLPQDLEKRVFVGTTIIYFMVGNLVKVVPYSLMGLMTRPNLLLSVVLAPAVLVGTLIGVYLNDKFSDKNFRLIIYGLAFLMGIYFLVT